MHVALIRGINVGKAKRVAMADLRALIAKLGYGDPRTLLNSGNVVFDAGREAAGKVAARIEEGMAAKLKVSARVTVLTGADFATVVEENPLGGMAANPSRLSSSTTIMSRRRARAWATSATRSMRYGRFSASP